MFFEEQEFHRCPACLGHPDEAGTAYPGIVEHHEGSLLKYGGQIPHHPVFQAAGFPVHHHETALSPLGRRVLGNEVSRKLKVKIGCSHGLKKISSLVAPLRARS